MSMKITELSRRTGCSIDQIRYLEKKGAIRPRWKLIKKRKVRHYPESQIHRLSLISRYLEEGYKYDTAIQKAENETNKPRLI